ncbi:ABC transporter [Kitasatospora sp. NPDC050463]|uniref:ABC transporter n=1 Tax=Kitasatospora sp. NPDC050463 TaxID=3155786 RepID=UPI0033F84243
MLTGPGRGAGAARLAVALLGPAVRLAPRLPLLAGALVALTVAGVPALLHSDLGLSDAALLTRLGAVTTALAVGFALDDAAARTTVVVPVPRLLQRTVRLLPVLVVAALTWTGVAALARLAVAAEARALYPWGGLALEAAGLAAVALALSALGLRFTEGEHGAMTAAPGLLLLVITAILLPDAAALFVSPGHPHWQAAHQAWAVLLVLGLAAAVLLGRGGPGVRGLRVRRRGGAR